MTMRISVETLVPIGVVIFLFLLAMLCLACSLNKSELMDCCLFRYCCCCCCRRRRPRDPNDSTHNTQGNADPQAYASLNEFIFQAEDEERPGLVSLAMNSMPTETTVQAVFPDLLGHPPGKDKGRRNNNNNNNTEGLDDNGNLNEPLL
jgi:hypothetical protein